MLEGVAVCGLDPVRAAYRAYRTIADIALGADLATSIFLALVPTSLIDLLLRRTSFASLLVTIVRKPRLSSGPAGVTSKPTASSTLSASTASFASDIPDEDDASSGATPTTSSSRSRSAAAGDFASSDSEREATASFGSGSGMLDGSWIGVDGQEAGGESRRRSE